jgi:hypothetical protein
MCVTHDTTPAIVLVSGQLATSTIGGVTVTPR